jgi:hypothetical protein
MKCKEDRKVSPELLSVIVKMVQSRDMNSRGVYRLSQAIENPCADRRRHDDWHAMPTIQPGVFYRIIQVRDDDDTRYVRIRLNRAGHRITPAIQMEVRLSRTDPSTGWVSFPNPLVSALLPHLTQTWDARGWLELVEQEDSTAPHEVIAVLIERGILTPALLESAAQEVRRRADEENEKASQ